MNSKWHLFASAPFAHTPHAVLGSRTINIMPNITNRNRGSATSETVKFGLFPASTLEVEFEYVCENDWLLFFRKRK